MFACIQFKHIIHRKSKKKQDIKLLSITSPNIDRFSKFFHCYTDYRKFAMKRSLQIPPQDRVSCFFGLTVYNLLHTLHRTVIAPTADVKSDDIHLKPTSQLRFDYDTTTTKKLTFIFCSRRMEEGARNTS